MTINENVALRIRNLKEIKDIDKLIASYCQKKDELILSTPKIDLKDIEIYINESAGFMLNEEMVKVSASLIDSNSLEITIPKEDKAMLYEMSHHIKEIGGDFDFYIESKKSLLIVN